MAWYDFLTGAYDWLTESRLASGGTLPVKYDPGWSDLDTAWGAAPARTSSYLEQAVDAALLTGGETLGNIKIAPSPRMQEDSLSMSMGGEEPMVEGLSFPYRPTRFASREATGPPPEAKPVYRPLAEMPVAERIQQQMIERVKGASLIGDERDEGGTRTYPGKGVMTAGLWSPQIYRRTRG